MMALSREVVKNIVPPALMTPLKYWKSKWMGGGYFSGPYRNWQAALKDAHGYNDPVIFEQAVQSYKQAQNAHLGFERDGVWIRTPEYSYPLIAYLLKEAMRNGSLSVIDFGGGLASTYFQLKPFLGKHVSVKWQVVEQLDFVNKCAQLEFPEDIVFHTSLTACDRTSHDVLLLSGVLQYLENPKDFIVRLKNFNFSNWFLDRVPVSKITLDQLLLQHVPKAHYQASYPSWLFSQMNFNQLLKESSGLEFQAEFDAIDGIVYKNFKKIEHKGFILGGV